MPVVNNSNVMSLTQWAASLGPDHKVQTRVAQLLAQQNGVVADAGWIMGNLATGHQGEAQTGLAPVYYTLMNQFVPVGQDTAMPFVETSARLEGYSQVDRRLYMLGGEGEGEKLRARRAKSFLENLNQTFSKTFFYGSSANPASFIGLSPRYSAIAAGGANAQNILDAGGQGSTNASIWMVIWGEETCTCFFPLGSKAGIDHRDLGLQSINSINNGSGSGQFSDSNPGIMEVYREHWEWQHGLYLPDWRYVVRIANIDVPSLLSGAGAADLETLLIQAYHHIPNVNAGRPALYMNRTVFEMWDVQKRNAVQKGGQLKYEVVDGVEVPVFRGMPVRLVDQLVNTESRVV